MNFNFCIQNVLGRCKHGSRCKYKHLDVCKSFFDYKQCAKSNCNKHHFYSQNAIDYSKQRFTRLCTNYQSNTCLERLCPFIHDIACTQFLQYGFCDNPKCNLVHTPLNKDKKIDKVCQIFNEFGECNKFKCTHGIHTRINPHEETKVFPYERICPCDSRKCRKKIHQPQCRNYKNTKSCTMKNCKFVHCEYLQLQPSESLWNINTNTNNYSYTYPEEQDYPPPIIVSSEEYNPDEPNYIPSSPTRPPSPNYTPSSPLYRPTSPTSPNYEPYPYSPSYDDPHPKKRTHDQISKDEAVDFIQSVSTHTF